MPVLPNATDTNTEGEARPSPYKVLASFLVGVVPLVGRRTQGNGWVNGMCSVMPSEDDTIGTMKCFYCLRLVDTAYKYK